MQSHRYFLYLSYNGANYSGWQIQPNAISLQKVLEEKISTLLQQPTNIVSAGRTDAGVHALQMIVHLDVKKPLDDFWIKKLNRFLPNDIAVWDAKLVTADAHARFSAIKRRYIYKMATKKSPFRYKTHWLIESLDVDLNQMGVALEILKKTNDFASFMKSNSSAKNSFCKVQEVLWQKNAQDEYILDITANRFLRNMVRAIVGTLVALAKKKISLEEFVEIINKKDRRFAGESAPAHGLYLKEISYPQEVFL